MKQPISTQHSRCVRLALVHHANQYLITNGYQERQGMGDILGLGSVFWEREFHRRGLLPLLQMHLEYRVPLNLHLSGTLIETLAWHYPESFALVRRLYRAGLLELIGSTFSQNVMPFFSEEYNLRQMNEELWLFRRHLGADLTRVKTFWVPERVWDTEKLARVLRSPDLLNGGYARVLLDDRLLYTGGNHYEGSDRQRFDCDGLLEIDSFRLWEIEGGHGLSVLPISKRLRYMIPPSNCDSWSGLHALFGWLKEIANEDVLAVYGDDLERAAGVGGWEPVHPEGYEQLLRWLSGNEHFQPVLVGEWAKGRSPAGMRRIECGTFYELAQLWGAGEDYRGWIDDPQSRSQLEHLARAERSLGEAQDCGADRSLIDLGWKHLLHSSYETSWHNRAEETPDRDFSYLDNGRGRWLAPWAAALTSHARCCHVIARAAVWYTSRDGAAHAEVADVDGDGEEELILRNDCLYAVFSPARGGRLIYLFDLTGRSGRLCIGNVSDDWNLQEEVNRYMDCPRNHPGALADVGHEHDRYDVFVTRERGQTAAASMVNVEPAGELSATEKHVRLTSGAGHLCVSYALPPERWRVSTEICLSPDYFRLLRNGKRGIAEFNGRDWRGWRNGAGRVWVRIDSRQSTIWDKPYQTESGHGFNLRVTSFSKNLHLELGVGIPPATPCRYVASNDRQLLPATAHSSEMSVAPAIEWDGPSEKPATYRPSAELRTVTTSQTTGIRLSKISLASSLRQVDYKALITNPHFMRNFLNRHLSSLGQHRLRIKACRISVLRPHHNKLTVEYNLQLTSDASGGACFTRTFVGTWRADEHNRQMHELLCALWNEGFDESNRLTVARPVAYWKSLHLRLREKVAGKLLREFLYYPDVQLDAPMRTVAAWLAKLHGLNVSVARRFDQHAKTEELRGWLDDLIACKEDWIKHERNRIGSLMDELIAVHAVRRPNVLCLTHGDFHAENIFLRGKTITVIDFEQSEIGDPAADLGYLLAQLDIQAGRYWERRGVESPLNVSRLQSVLLEEYSRLQPENGCEWTPFYMASTYFKHLMHTVRMNGTESPRLVTLWLDRASQYLNGLNSLTASRQRLWAATAIKSP